MRDVEPGSFDPRPMLQQFDPMWTVAIVATIMLVAGLSALFARLA